MHLFPPLRISFDSQFNAVSLQSTTSMAINQLAKIQTDWRAKYRDWGSRGNVFGWCFFFLLFYLFLGGLLLQCYFVLWKNKIVLLLSVLFLNWILRRSQRPFISPNLNDKSTGNPAFFKIISADFLWVKRISNNIKCIRNNIICYCRFLLWIQRRQSMP